MLFGARETGCFREVAALHSDHLGQVPLYIILQRLALQLNVHTSNPPPSQVTATNMTPCRQRFCTRQEDTADFGMVVQKVNGK